MSRIIDAGDLLSLLTGGKIASLDSLVNLLTGGGAGGEPEFIYSHKDQRVQGATGVSPIAGAMHSLFMNDGTPLPGAPAPGAFAIPTNTSAGSLMQANPGGGRSKLVTSATGVSNSAGYFTIYDRLLHMSGMDGTLTTVQNVNGGASADVTRYTNGVGNQLWLEIYSALGATATSATVVYKDGSGATQTAPGTPIGTTNLKEAGRIIPVPLVSGGSTVMGVTSVQLAASTLTAGNFGVTIAHPLIEIPISAPLGAAVDINFLCHSIPELLSNAALYATFIPALAGLTTWDFSIQSVEI